MNSNPLETMPMISKAKIAVSRLLSCPPTCESLLGILSAEKSITVCPTWKVEGV